MNLNQRYAFSLKSKAELALKLVNLYLLKK
jgi:hypothetical protein